jgi:uncharacterized protein YkwD
MRKILIALAIAFAASTPASAQSMDGFGRHLADLINRYREGHGLSPLSIAQDLVTLAAEHSTDMASRRQLTHEGFRDRYTRTGSRMCVENVGWNYPTAEALLDGWRHSPEHLRNLLEPQVARMGIVADSRYVTFFACL